MIQYWTWTFRVASVAVLPALLLACGMDDSGTGPTTPADASADQLNDTQQPEAGVEASKADSEAGAADALDAKVDNILDSADAPETTGCDTSKAPWEDTCGVQDKYGLFVSPKGNDNNPGTQELPFRTIQAALNAAESNLRPKVFVCADGDTYEEAVTAKSGVAVFGGFDCSDWKYSQKHAKVVAPAGSKAALTVGSGLTNVWIAEIDFESPDATEAGGSSLGAYVENASVKLERLTITAGKGKEGGAPAAKPDKGADGLNGQPGQDANCGDAGGVMLGGEAVVNNCTSPNSPSTSGIGGPAVLNGSGQAGGDGQQANAGSVPPADGYGGMGGKIGGGALCANGNSGAAGPAGTPGTAGPKVGSVTSASYVPADGLPGTAGVTGQAGGGGGASAGATGCLGASGGSGGAGGCGGPGGLGGKGGGASIALVVIQGGAGIILKDVTLKAQDGGKGGDGQEAADPGHGGPGGHQGYGIPSKSIKDGCAGGQGGTGGLGGGGGGGTGGPSVALWYTGINPKTNTGSSGVQLVTGSAGGKGKGGAPNGADGEDGLAESEHSGG